MRYDKWKTAILEAAETDTIFLNRRHGPGLRALRTERSEALEDSPDNVMGEFGNAMALYFGGDMNASLALTGQVAGRIDEIRPVGDVIAECVEEFHATLDSLADAYLRAGPQAT